MSILSSTPVERARNALSAVLQRLNVPGTSEATISRLKNEHLEPLLTLLAFAGFKVVGAERVCVDPQTYEALTHIASKAMADVETTRKLLWEGE